MENNTSQPEHTTETAPTVPTRSNKKLFLTLAILLVILLTTTIAILVFISQNEKETANNPELDIALNSATVTRVAAIASVLSNAKSVDATVTISNGTVTTVSDAAGETTIPTKTATVTYQPKPNGQSTYTVTEETPETGCVFTSTENDMSPTAQGNNCEYPK